MDNNISIGRYVHRVSVWSFQSGVFLKEKNQPKVWNRHKQGERIT